MYSKCVSVRGGGGGYEHGTHAPYTLSGNGQEQGGS